MLGGGGGGEKRETDSCYLKESAQRTHNPVPSPQGGRIGCLPLEQKRGERTLHLPQIFLQLFSAAGRASKGDAFREVGLEGRGGIGEESLGGRSRGTKKPAGVRIETTKNLVKGDEKNVQGAADSYICHTTQGGQK